MIDKIIEGITDAVGGYLAGEKKKKAGKIASKENKRETIAHLINDALQGSGELQAHGMSSRSRLGKRRSQSQQDTSDLVRGALNI